MPNWTNVSLQGRTTSCSHYEDNLYVKDLDSLYITSIFLIVTNCFTALTAILGNALVIWAILTTSSLHNTSNILLCCLAGTDLLTGLITQPIWTVKLVQRIVGNYPIYCFISKLLLVPGMSLNSASFLTISVINLDRLLAVNLHLRYEELITVKRVLSVEAVVFIISVSVGVLPLVLSATSYRYLVVVFMLLNVVINLVLYKRIAHIVRKHERAILAQINIVNQLQGETHLDFKKFKKSAGTVSAIFGLFCLCYIPSMCVSVVQVYMGSDVLSWEVKSAYEVSYLVIMINSSLNPFLYCLRITDIRCAVLKILRKVQEWTTVCAWAHELGSAWGRKSYAEK